LIDLGIEKNQKISAENKAKIEANLAAKIEAILDASTKKYFSFYFKDLLFSLGRNQKNQAKNFSNFASKIYIKPTSNLADSLAKNIIAFIVKFPELARFRDEDFDVRELHFINDNLTHLKELLIDKIDEGEINLLSTLENPEFHNDIADIKNILARLATSDLDSALIKFRVLLLRDLLLQVDLQYKDSLSRIDEIEAHQTIFDYRTSLEHKILSLEKEIT